MFIFGWGRRLVEDFGPITEKQCPSCTQTRIWTLHRVTTWFTCFFVRTFAYKTVYCIACPECLATSQLEKNDFFKLKPIAENLEYLNEGRITKEECEKKIERSQLPVQQFISRIPDIFWQAPLGILTFLLFSHFFK